MATENQKSNIEQNPSPDDELFAGKPQELLQDNGLFTEKVKELPPDSELFAGKIREDLSEHDVFAGDESFYKSIASNAKLLMPFRHRPLSITQKILIAGIILVATILLYNLGRMPSSEQKQHDIAQQTPPIAQQAPEQAKDTEPPFPPDQPLSLQVAQTFYQNGYYDKAYTVYNQLRKNLSNNTEEQLMSDFLQLRMALAQKNAGKFDRATQNLKAILRSRSPIVRIAANYQLCLIELHKAQYLKARTRAYQTIALIDAISPGNDWVLPLQRDCYFLLAQSMTRSILSLCDADKNIPQSLWANYKYVDPFANLEEEDLRDTLNSGSKQLSKALLSPKIQKLLQPGTAETPRWSVTCHGASIEELMTRFATNAGMDLCWNFRPDSLGIRKRIVSLYLNSATIPQIITTAAGCVGLMARLENEKNIHIFDTTDYSSLSEHTSLLNQEAISVWQKFLLTFHNDPRIINAHFALGLLYEQKGLHHEANAELKLVANRFSKDTLAPFALLHSSRLKTNVRDYTGARQDLKQLVEQYPDAEITGLAHLNLAETTAKAGLHTEASRIYKKVYNLALTNESQSAAAIGAARCFYQTEEYKSAEKWLIRYIKLEEGQKNQNIHSAYFLLGRTFLALEKPNRACNSLMAAIEGKLSRKEYVQAISDLIKGYIKQKKFVKALEVLENVYSWQFSQKEFVEVILLKSKIFRAMGLADKAIIALGDRIEYIGDQQLKAKAYFELSNCYIDNEDLELAHKNLARCSLN